MHQKYINWALKLSKKKMLGYQSKNEGKTCGMCKKRKETIEHMTKECEELKNSKL